MKNHDKLFINGSWVASTGEARLEVPWEPSPHFRLVPGVDFVGGQAKFKITLPFNPTNFAETDPLAEREPYSVSDQQPSHSPEVSFGRYFCFCSALP